LEGCCVTITPYPHSLHNLPVNWRFVKFFICAWFDDSMLGTIHSPESPIFKALVLFCSLALVGAGLVARHLETRSAPRLQNLVRLAAVFLIVSSLVEVGFTAWRALLELSPNLYGAYLTTSRHGQWVLARVAAAVVLFWLGAMPRRELQRFKNADIYLHSAAGLVLGLSLSMTTHAGSLGEVLPVASDLSHLFAMTIWIGGVAFLALSKRANIQHIQRVSSLAAVAVGVLTLTGIYQSLIKLWNPALLLETQYGITLVVKLLLFTLVLGLAAANRFYWLPQLERRPKLLAPFKTSVRLELVLLCTVLLSTATLGSTAPPERDVVLVAPIQVKQKIGVWTLEASAITPAIGGLRLEFRIFGETGYSMTQDSRVDVALSMPSDGMTIRQTPTRLPNGSYRLETRLGMPGEWKIIVQVPGATWRIPIRFKD
jgi:copper resistance protein D